MPPENREHSLPVQGVAIVQYSRVTKYMVATARYSGRISHTHRHFDDFLHVNRALYHLNQPTTLNLKGGLGRWISIYLVFIHRVHFKVIVAYAIRIQLFKHASNSA